MPNGEGVVAYYEKTKTPFILMLIINFFALICSFYLVSQVLGFANNTLSIATYLAIYISIMLFLLYFIILYLRRRDMFLFLLFGGLMFLALVVGTIYLMVEYYNVPGYIVGLFYLIGIMAVAGMISYFLIFIVMIGWFGIMNTEKKITEHQGGYRK